MRGGAPGHDRGTGAGAAGNRASLGPPRCDRLATGRGRDGHLDASPDPPHGAPAAHRRSPTRWPRPRPAADRPHSAAKRYIYAWGAGGAEGNALDARPARRQGRGPRRDDQGRPADAARLHDHDRGLQRLLRSGEQLPRRPVGRRPRRGQARSSDETGKGFGDPANPLLVSVRSGAKFSMPGMMDTVLNLGPQRGDAAGPGRPDRQRALRLGRLSPLHPDVRADRHGRRRASGSTTPSRPPRTAHGADARTPTSTPTPCRSSSPSSRTIVRADTGRDFPDDPLRAARPGDQGGLRHLVRQARPRLPQEPEDRRRPRARPSTS